MTRQGALGAVVLAGFVAVVAGRFVAETSARQADTAEPLRGIAEYVLEAGAAMTVPSTFCELLELSKASEPCPYAHVGMSNGTESKAVEVGRDARTGGLSIVIGWKTEEEGYLFRVTPAGELLKAVYMKKDAKPVVVPNASVQSKAQQEIAFWLAQEPRLRASQLAK